MTCVDPAITVCYANFSEDKLWDLTITMTLGSISSDEADAGGGGRDDVPEYQHVDQFTFSPSEANVFQWPWGYLYKTINFCNIAIAKLPLINKSTDSTFDPVIIHKRLGEAHFLRALNYFTLNQIYGGVPVTDHVPLVSEYTKGRDDISKSYDLIKADCHYAIDALPEKGGWGQDVGRATKGAAQALLAKVFLYESSYAKYYPGDDRFKGMSQHWDSALYYAQQVINSGKYQLVGSNGERFMTYFPDSVGGYKYIFMAAADNSPEGVFEIQNVEDGLGWYNSRGESCTKWQAPREVGPGTTNGVDFGWGWEMPTRFLASAYEPGDPRYKATVLLRADSVQTKTNWSHPNFNTIFANTGDSMYSRKYEAGSAEYWAKTGDYNSGPVDIKLIRYADVVLWAAEASFELGNNDASTGSLYYINLVRTRARMSGNTGAPANLVAITHDDIVHERLVELACEGHRFFDLVRWNLANKYLNTTLMDGTPVTFIPIKNDFFPIPEREIGLSGNNLKQYPGW
jgi:hypothetical protein